MFHKKSKDVVFVQKYKVIQVVATNHIIGVKDHSKIKLFQSMTFFIQTFRTKMKIELEKKGHNFKKIIDLKKKNKNN